ncbi:hypothetical protein RFI_36094 [Reticulomyxa filosa]|uniref:AAA+ ATPase domain-containing protein n=1 Tax=Reticulomyxa filosa TaxID=46433 RepID=X6LJN1_RETFI|nr:hypothetical protein RFI_36094 [Reticulomyxa filosa]|eukprot:ETO01347.1 hypothetical protein RFI_36094 [Reticulomyxa filosa]
MAKERKSALNLIIQREFEKRLITVTNLLCTSQEFIRQKLQDTSVVSLRDVERCLTFFVWISNHFYKQTPISEQIQRSLIVSVGLCYYFRLNKDDRIQYSSAIKIENTTFKNILYEEVDRLCKTFSYPPGTLFFSIYLTPKNDVCCKVIVIGEPGTSKTLSLEILRHNLSESNIEEFQAKLNERNFKLKVKPLHLVSFQCTQDSKPFGIIERWKQATDFLKDPVIWPVLLLDEIGLAERSKHSPLKVLHHLLERPQIAFVGLSNWSLDAAKMNRVIIHQIPSIAPTDLENIAKKMYQDKRKNSTSTKISTSEHDIELLVDVFKELFTTKTMDFLTFGETNYLGTRDFYALIRHSLGTGQNPCQSFEGVMRNLGGYKGKEYQDALTNYLQKRSGLRKEQVLEKMNCWEALQCVKANLNDVHCRHCLLICENQYSWQLLLDHNILSHHDVTFLFESRFPADLIASTNSDHLQKVSNCMEAGKKVLLFNLKSIHECLYDMLNQRYQINRQGYCLYQLFLKRIIYAYIHICLFTYIQVKIFVECLWRVTVETALSRMHFDALL